MGITVNQMIHELQEMADAGYGERDVSAVFQPHYPMEAAVRGVWMDDGVSEACRECEEASARCDQCEHKATSTREDVYIVLGDARDYGPYEAFEGC